MMKAWRSVPVAVCLVVTATACSTTSAPDRATTGSMDQQSTSNSASPSIPPILSIPPTTAAPQPDPELEMRDADGRTPLVVATKAGDAEAARTLILAGADVNAKDNMSDSAFLFAGAEGMDEILILTLAHGADVRSLNRFGGTALIPAAEKGHPTTVQLLIDAGVPLDHVNDSGWTALLEAVVYGDGSQRYQDVVGRLVAAGADPDIRDLQGRTALDNARIRGQAEVVRILGG
jgi:uncharacterized protein